MAQSHSEAATLDSTIVKVKEASKQCYLVHQADAQWLVEFCCKVVEAIATFRETTVNMIDVNRLQAEGGTAELIAMLKCSVIYLEDRSDTAVRKATIMRFLGMDDAGYHITTLENLKDLARRTVVNRYIEPVVNCVEVSTQSFRIVLGKYVGSTVWP